MENTAPPIDLDLSSVDTSLPLVAKSYQDLRIVKAEIKKTNAGDAEYINLDLETTAPSTSVKGENLGPGIHIFDTVMLAPTGKATWDMVSRNLGALVQAVGFPKGTARVVNGKVNAQEWVPQLAGRVVRTSIDYEPEGVAKNGKSYRAKNVILMYLKQK